MPYTARIVCLLLAGLAARPGAHPKTWDTVVKHYIQSYQSIRQPAPVAYPQMAERIRTLFYGRKVSHIRVSSEELGKRRTEADIYYRSGELHIVAHRAGWNLVTRGADAYEWEVGKKRGIITHATPEDLVEYLLYDTDVSYIMTSLYHDYLTDPTAYRTPALRKDGCLELRPKQRDPRNPFTALYVTEKPLWFCGFETTGGSTRTPVRMMYSHPEALQQIPAEVFERLKGIRFVKSKESIRRHLVYL